MSMYVLEYSNNYTMRSGSFGDYCRDEVNDGENENDNANVNRINDKKWKVFLLKVRQK